jgi:hypothetical protein
VARFAVSEYAVDLPGPEALAIHVLDGLAGAAAPAGVKSMGDPAIAGAPERNREVAGAAVTRDGRTTFVVTAASARAAADSSRLSYFVPVAGPTRQVVFDAPEDGQGRASVEVTPAGDGRCRVSLSAGGARPMAGRPLIFTLAPAAAGGGCVAREDAAAPMSGGSVSARPDLPAARRAHPAGDKLRRLLHRARHLPHKKALAAGAGAAGLLVLALLWWAVAGRSRRREA